MRRDRTDNEVEAAYRAFRRVLGEIEMINLGCDAECQSRKRLCRVC